MSANPAMSLNVEIKIMKPYFEILSSLSFIGCTCSKTSFILFATPLCILVVKDLFSAKGFSGVPPPAVEDILAPAPPLPDFSSF
jgi:hypothetical protein